jgi:hypothetical protein
MVGLAEFSLLLNGSGIHPAHCSVCTELFFPGEKWPSCEVNHILLLSAEVKKEGSCISSPPILVSGKKLCMYQYICMYCCRAYFLHMF